MGQEASLDGSYPAGWRVILLYPTALKTIRNINEEYRNMIRAFLCIVLCALLFPAFSSIANASGKPRIVALVIGNDAYSGDSGGYLPELHKAVADGKAVESRLRALGANVKFIENAKGVDVKNGLIDWQKRIKQDDIAFFYFAGHGFSAYAWVIVAVNAQKLDELIQEDAIVEMSAVIHYADKSSGVSTDGIPQGIVVVLDACRSKRQPNDDLADRADGRGIRAWAQKQEQTRNAPVEISRGFRGGHIGSSKVPYFVIYSTDANNTVSELYPGANSLFTDSFVRHVGDTGLSLTQLATIINKEVTATTGASQQPWGEGSPKLYGLQLFPALKPVTPPAPKQGTASTPSTPARRQPRPLPLRPARVVLVSIEGVMRLRL